MAELNNKMKVDWVILADSAQVIGGKLFMLGGGWDRVVATRPLPVLHPMAIAIGIRVPWNETNQPHRLDFAIVDDDGTEKIVEGQGEFEVGRAVGIKPGQDQRFQMALNFQANFKEEGEYAVIVEVNGIEMERTPFFVGIAPGARAKTQTQGEGRQ